MTISVAEKPAANDLVKRPRLAVGSGRLEEHFRRHHFFPMPDGATKEDPLYPEFWAGSSKGLSRHDIVTLLPVDQDWEMEVTIEKVLGDAGAEVSVRKVYSRKGVEKTMTEIAEGIHTEFRAGMGWCVVRRADGAVIERGHALESIAIASWQRAQPRPVV